MPNGRTGHDHQYHGFNNGAPGNVMTLLGPQGTLQRSLRSEASKRLNCIKISTKLTSALFEGAVSKKN